MSSDVTVTLSGFVGTTPRLFTSAGGTDWTSFRIASTKRFLDRATGQWVDGRTIWFTVKVWRAVARNVAESLRKGDAVVVTGRLAVDEWSGPEGPRTDLVVEATSLGPDLARGTARFTPVVHRRELGGDGAEGTDGTGTTGAGETGQGAAGVAGGAPADVDPWALAAAAGAAGVTGVGTGVTDDVPSDAPDDVPDETRTAVSAVGTDGTPDTTPDMTRDVAPGEGSAEAPAPAAADGTGKAGRVLVGAGRRRTA